MAQSRRWCFTWNNYAPVAEDICKDFSEQCNYLVYGKEEGDSGTPHLQGFFTLKKQKRLAALKKVFGPTVHFEIAKGTSLQASEYCKKDQDYVEFGTPPTPGKRTDLEAAIDALKEGQTMNDLAESHPSQVVKYGRGLRDLKLLLDKPYNHDDVRGEWYWGPPGTGKSLTARDSSYDPYLKAQNKWWDGYAGQTTVILDDLDSNVLGHYLKIWADRYACTGETKGGTINLQHEKIIVTSNYSIEALWPDDLEMQQAIKRRFKEVHFTKPYNFLEMEKERKKNTPTGDDRMTFNLSI